LLKGGSGQARSGGKGVLGSILGGFFRKK